VTNRNGNDPLSGIAVQEEVEGGPVDHPEQPQTTLRQLFATRKQKPSTTPQQNKIVLIAGGAVAVALLLFVFSSAPARKHPAMKGRLETATQTAEKKPASDDADEQKSLFPITQSSPPKRSSALSSDGPVAERDLEHMVRHPPQATVRSVPEAKPPQAGSLGSIPPFDQGVWQAPPYQPSNTVSEPVNNAPKPEREVLPSLVFVQKLSPATPKAQNGSPSFDNDVPTLGLPVGTRLRARLESAVSTAVSTPVIATIEYNYESDGEIVVPAGTKAFGRIEQADRSGYLSIKFSSFLMPDGASISIEAVATDLNIAPLRGKVEGKNSGKNALVRSLSGVGQVAALVAGRGGSINQPFSESDLIRERVSTNVGESADQEVMRLAVTEHIVVSVPASTPIYVVLQKTAKGIPDPENTRIQQSDSSKATANSTESLRQLLQLQRELNQGTDSSH
jgi:Bacterial conjugation TrbI-like protein